MILMQLDRDSHRQILCSTRLADTAFTALKIRTTDHLTYESVFLGENSMLISKCRRESRAAFVHLKKAYHNSLFFFLFFFTYMQLTILRLPFGSL